MSEFEHNDSHIVDQEVTPQQESTEVQTEQTNVSEQQFDTIRYHKEDVQLPVDKRKDYLEQGYYWEQKGKAEFEQLKEQNAYIDRMAKISGFDSRDDFFEAIAEQERQAQIEAEAERLGVTSEAYQQFLAPVNDELAQLKEQLNHYQQQEAVRNVDSEVLALQTKYDDFKDHEQAVFDLAIQKGYSLEDSYVLVTHAAKVESAKLEAQQQAINSLQQKQLNSVGSLSGGDGGQKTSISGLSKADFEKMKQGVLNGQIKQF